MKSQKKSNETTVLAIESSTAQASVALSCMGDIIQRTSINARTQGEQLLQLVDEVLKEAGISLREINGITYGRGPGSFTGVRIAAAVAQGLAYSVNKPIATVSTLAAMAQQVYAEYAFANGEPYAVLVCLDARKQQVYTAQYETNSLICSASKAVRTNQEKVLSPQHVNTGTNRMIGTGNGFEVYPSLREKVVDVHAQGSPQARYIAQIATGGSVKFDSAFLANPVYIRDNVTHGS